MEAVKVLQAEHDGVLAVLAQLERAVSAAERGAPVPPGIFSDVQEFFAVFVDRCHHSKEEVAVFPRLEGGARARLIQELEAGHTRGRQLATAYAAAARAYSPGDAASGQQLAAAARAYAVFLREHIDEEAHELFPVMEESLAADDAAMVAEFERIEEERIGPGTHERLHRMIDNLPPRIDPFVQ